MNEQGRPTAPVAAVAAEAGTFTGNRGLQMEEPLIFETGRHDVTGVDLPEEARSAGGATGIEGESARSAGGATGIEGESAGSAGGATGKL
ncbi:MAG: hypothetical protein KDJ86_17315, partial [Bauldia sp.]|nr:hypothetical protein [Bauldia sp.]